MKNASMFYLKNKWFPYAIIAGAVLLVYFRSLFFGFVWQDDQKLILNNIAFLSQPSNVLSAFSNEVFNGTCTSALYRPLLIVSFMADAFWGGSAPFIYHLTNIWLHALAGAALFMFLRYWGLSVLRSLLAALVFVVHPALSHAVAWIPGRNDVMLALFALAAFIAFIKFINNRDKSSLAAHALLYACALFTKENAVVLPFLLVFYSLSVKRPAVGRRALALPAAVWLGVTLVWFLARSAALDVVLAGSHYNIARSLYDNMPALLPYLGKAFFPFNLSVVPVIADMSQWPGLAALFVIAAALIMSRGGSSGKIVFGVLWFLFWLVPTFIRPSTPPPDFSEHRGYVPLIGLLLLAGEIHLPIKRGHLLAMVCLVLVVFSGQSIYRLGYFRDRLSFWENGVATSPSNQRNREELAVAYEQAAGNYYEKGFYPQAEMLLLKAMKLLPNDANLKRVLGAVYISMGRVDDCEKMLEASLLSEPGNIKTLNNLAVLNAQKNNMKRAAFYVAELVKRKVAVQPALLKATAPYRK